MQVYKAGTLVVRGTLLEGLHVEVKVGGQVRVALSKLEPHAREVAFGRFRRNLRLLLLAPVEKLAHTSSQHQNADDVAKDDRLVLHVARLAEPRQLSVDFSLPDRDRTTRSECRDAIESDDRPEQQSRLFLMLLVRDTLDADLVL